MMKFKIINILVLFLICVNSESYGTCKLKNSCRQNNKRSCRQKNRSSRNSYRRGPECWTSVYAGYPCCPFYGPWYPYYGPCYGPWYGGCGLWGPRGGFGFGFFW